MGDFRPTTDVGDAFIANVELGGSSRVGDERKWPVGTRWVDGGHYGVDQVRLAAKGTPPSRYHSRHLMVTATELRGLVASGAFTPVERASGTRLKSTGHAALRRRYGRAGAKGGVRLTTVPSLRHSGLAVVLADGDQILDTLLDGATSVAAKNTIKGLPRPWAKQVAEIAASRADSSSDPRVYRHAAALLWPVNRNKAQSYLKHADRLDPQRVNVVVPQPWEEERG